MMLQWLAALALVASAATNVQDSKSQKKQDAQDKDKPSAELLRIDFDKMEAGKPPKDWSIRHTHKPKSPAIWKVTADPKAPSKPNVLTLTTENSGGTFNLLVGDKTSFKDLDLSVKIRANTGEQDRGGGLIWRCKDEDNYYICRANPLENNFRVYHVISGVRQQMDTANLKLESDRWYTIRVVMVGEQIACYLDGKKMLEAKDESFKDAGMIGLWTKADAASSFDDLVVSVPGHAKHADAKADDKEKMHEGKRGDDDDDDDDEK